MVDSPILPSKRLSEWFIDDVLFFLVIQQIVLQHMRRVMTRDIIPIGNNVAASIIKLSVTSKLPLIFVGLLQRRSKYCYLKSNFIEINKKRDFIMR